ncbi:hypothetical protein [Acidipila sp. EB88]|uniref:hypothetical protein n=1 Tax=Acidipila sp. EB88 TaxID=2305226 RepID=UPI000F5F31BB|nr:hypothetical protein [Acidipila sp. EB88]RRA50353.1 hypothetical protein D1Y84_00920 [Acidipila sp. EB88]RRA50361.1 hypothetical protein D1Y84_00960 [Acidipila sp. EB88]
MGTAKVKTSGFASALQGIRQNSNGSPATPAKGERTAKSTDPAYKGTKVFLHSETRKLAWRKWEDEHPETPDLSDMLQALMLEYLEPPKHKNT